MAAMMHPAAPREAQLAAAISLHQQGQLDAAEAAYAALLKRQPRHFDGLHLSGVAALQNGRLEEGITRIRRAIAINPRAAAAHSNLGSGLLRLGRFAEALTSLDRALKLDP
ncbi:MAG: tetratricopeptide repeat protein, partial [Acetobacteraceae bacterium]|nr:tetratricopeptide repeat protein [Acetobacteraceae bacterium]